MTSTDPTGPGGCRAPRPWAAGWTWPQAAAVGGVHVPHVLVSGRPHPGVLSPGHDPARSPGAPGCPRTGTLHRDARSGGPTDVFRGVSAHLPRGVSLVRPALRKRGSSPRSSESPECVLLLPAPSVSPTPRQQRWPSGMASPSALSPPLQFHGDPSSGACPGRPPINLACYLLGCRLRRCDRDRTRLLTQTRKLAL